MGKLMARIRYDGQRKTQETITSKLQQNCRQHYRSTGGRFHVCIRQPRMDRPHWHLYRKCKQEGEKYQYLRSERQWQPVIIQYGKTATGNLIQVNECDQHEQ